MVPASLSSGDRQIIGCTSIETWYSRPITGGGGFWDVKGPVFVSRVHSPSPGSSLGYSGNEACGVSDRGRDLRSRCRVAT